MKGPAGAPIEEPASTGPLLTPAFLVRHGRTALNAEGRFRGRQDPPLDEVGRNQAAEAARTLRSIGLVAVYTSPLLRAVQTAEAVAQAAGVHVTVLEGLIDLDYGHWEGLTEDEARRRDEAAFRTFRAQPWEAIAPGGEALIGVVERVRRALVEATSTHPGQPVAAVSHEVPIRLLVARARGIDDGSLWDLPLSTGSVTELTVTPEGGIRINQDDSTPSQRRPRAG